MAKSSKVPFLRPVIMLWLLAILGLASTAFSVWGVWRVTDLATGFQSKEDRALVLAVNLKEQLASFSKLTYDFLLQNDFNRMMLKEKQSDKTRDDISRNVSAMVALSTQDTSTNIESIRYNILQFLVLSDKALETAVEDGNAIKARGILQDEVETALKAAQDAVSILIASRQKVTDKHFQFMREQSLVVVFLLVGLAALAMAVVLSVRMHLLQTGKDILPTPKVEADPPPMVLAPPPLLDTEVRLEPKAVPLEAHSLATLAHLNRLDKMRRDMDELKNLLQTVERSLARENATTQAALPDTDMQKLANQGEKIAMAVGRVASSKEQSKMFLNTLSELMSSMQALATEGNVIALNVTIELAKLQAHMHGNTQNHEEKNTRISDQIRAMATSAAGITGKLAMILSQFRYAHDDFARQVDDLVRLKDEGDIALDHVKQALQAATTAQSQLRDEKNGISTYLPLLHKKLNEMDQQMAQMESMAKDDAAKLGMPSNARSFKVISGGAA